MKRKLIALLLVVVMVMALLPATALAHEGTYDEHDHENIFEFIRVVIDAGEHGGINSPAWQIVPMQGDNWTFTAIPDSGYKFSHWTYDGNEASGAFSTSGANEEVLEVDISQMGVPGYLEKPSWRPRTWYWVDADYMKYKAQAVFIEDTTVYDVTLDLGAGGTFDSNGQSTIVVRGQIGDAFSLPDFSENEGYDHIGWTETPDFSSSRTIGSRYNYQVTFEGNDQVTITGGSPAWTSNGSVAQPSYNVADGYRFNGWSRSLSGITAPCSITANPAVGIGTITLEHTTGGDIALESLVEGTYDNGTSIRLSDSIPYPDLGWLIRGWKVGDTDVYLVWDAVITVDGDETYTAVFYDAELLSTKAGVNGWLDNPLHTWEYGRGDEINLNICNPQPASGFVFDKWIETDIFDNYQRDVALVGGEPIITMGDSNYFMALFKVAEYTVTFEDSQGEELGTEVVLHGGNITKTAADFTYDAGERPVGSGFDQAEGQGITQSKTIVVNTEYEVTFDLDGGTRTGGGELTQWIAYDGDATAPDVDPPSGKYFAGWDKALSGIKLAQTITAEFADKTEIILTANSDTVTYDGTEQVVSGFTGLPSGLTIEGVSASGSGTNVGTYDVTFTTGEVHIYDGAEDVTERYSISYVNGTLTINKADMTVSASGYSATYDGVAHDGVASIVLSETDATITYSTDAATYSSTMPQFTNAGTYTVYVKATKANFNDATTSVTVQIDKADATITANDKSKTYGDADPALDATVTGAVNGETLDYSLSRAPGENAGTYDINVTLGSAAVNDNYNITVNGGTLTINKAVATITANDKSKTYGQPDPALDATVTGTVNGETLDYALVRVPGEDAGTYEIIVILRTRLPDSIFNLELGDGIVGIGSVNDNYNITTNNGTFTINEAELTVTADDKTITFLDAAPTYTVSYSGFVGSEDESVLGGTLQIDCSYTQGAAAGTYAIEASGLTSGNYNITYVDGTLTVDELILTVTFSDHDGTVLGTDSVVYGDPATAPAEPTREGYTFAGWNVDFSEVKTDLDVTATYTINTFEVKFFDHDGTQIGDTQIIDWNTPATAPADPDRLGHTFAGWDTEFDAVKADLDVTATYTINSYTVTFVDHDGTVLKSQRVHWRGAATAPEDPSREGYDFKGWDTEFDRVVRYLTVTAVYDEVEEQEEPEGDGFLVQFFDADGNLISEQTVEEGGAAEAPEPPEREGYEFAGWDTEFNEVTRDLIVTALYTKLEVPSTDIIEDEPSAEADLTDTVKNPFPWWWIVIGAGAAAILLLILFFVKRRKDEEEEA